MHTLKKSDWFKKLQLKRKFEREQKINNLNNILFIHSLSFFYLVKYRTLI